ncbi:MAG: zinc-binding dehydrogenase [Longispora sp.]|nr:zinc-binding dehydrogenase [Longispora sp. (in: high G+C Gram-positive bacteria)]
MKHNLSGKKVCIKPGGLQFTLRASEVFAGIIDGTLKITIGGTYPLAEAHRAHVDLAGRRTTGKLLLIP